MTVNPLKIYKALADETRLRLVRLLVRGALNVNEITGILGMGPESGITSLKGFVRGRPGYQAA